MNIAKLIVATARQRPQAPALTDLCGTKTYAEFGSRAGSVASSLAAEGVVPGQRVVLYMENNSAFFECLVACWIIGACAVPVNAKLHVRELAFIVADCEARILFTDSTLHDGVAQELANHPGGVRILSIDGSEYRRMACSFAIGPLELNSASHAWQFYTSGTTGRPKGAVLTHGNLLAMSLAYYADIDAVDDRDHHLILAAASHASGLYALPHLFKGGHQVIFTKFDTKEVLDAIGRYPNSSMFMAPTMLNRLVRDSDTPSADLTNLKTIYYGGAPMYVSDLQAALGLLGPKLCQIYGQGETPNTITALSKRAHMPGGDIAPAEVLGSCGVARLGNEVKVVDANGDELPTGECGEIATRGPTVMEGYWNNLEATEKSLRDGWLFTGDIGRFDEAGNLTLIDRSKDVIISGGSNIYPREVEEILLRHPAVFEVSVAGERSNEWGEEVVAFISVREGHPLVESELDNLCLGNLARFKRPKRYVVLPELPKSANGKVLKSELRAYLERHAQPDGTAA